MDFQTLMGKVGDLGVAISNYLGDSAWLKALQNVVNGLDWLKARYHQGPYKVLDYEAALELRDKHGYRAFVSKYEKVQYLQDDVIAFQDQAWGDGKILKKYNCTPGLPVDTYRSGFKNHILVSLRGARKTGDIDEFHISWEIRDGFLRHVGYWATEICHYTEKIKMRVIFPKGRPPQSASVIQKNQRKATPLGSSSFVTLPGGRQEIVWEKVQPKLFEQYILQWKW
ncbi:MAG TPA: hypothetical protein VN374_04580 [Desulfitobacteriaceae bacterium]|nr:hypothetical protein [Desulfitobacteriaceae bacterium]